MKYDWKYFKTQKWANLTHNNGRKSKWQKKNWGRSRPSIYQINDIWYKTNNLQLIEEVKWYGETNWENMEQCKTNLKVKY